MHIKKIFILTFGTDAYGQGGDEFYFSSYNKAKKELLRLAFNEKLKIEWTDNIEFHLVNINDDTDDDTVYANITEIQVN